MIKIRSGLKCIVFALIILLLPVQAYDDNSTYFTCYNGTDCNDAVLNTTYTYTRLGADNTTTMTFFDNPGIASNYVFDLNGRTISLTGGNTSALMWDMSGSQKTNITLKNGTIQNFGVAVYWRGFGGEIRNMNFTNNTIGFRIYYGTGWALRDSEFIKNGQGVTAFGADSGRTYTFRNLTFSNSTTADIKINLNPVVRISNITSNGSYQSLYLTTISSGLIINNSRFTYCYVQCLNLQNENNVSVINNTFDHNPGADPISFVAVDDSIINTNTIYNNTRYGIWLQPGNDNVTITDNIFLNYSGQHAMLLFMNRSNVSNNTINIVGNISTGGIDLDQTDNNTISYNTITSTSPARQYNGIELSNGANSTSVLNNSVSGFNVAIWFYYDGAGHPYPEAYNNTIKYNNLFDNNYGIDVNYSDKNYIESNNFTNNSVADINIEQSGINTHVYNQTNNSIRILSLGSVYVGFGGSESVFNTTGSTFVLNVSKWDIIGDYRKIFNLSASASVTAGDFAPNTNNWVYKNGVKWTILKSNSTGYISFSDTITSETQYSTTSTTVQDAYKTSTCQSALNWGVVGSALIIVLILISAGGLALGFMTGTLKFDTFPIQEFVLSLVAVVVIGSIGVAIINPIIIVVGCP